jgi:hypothetical protein
VLDALYRVATGQEVNSPRTWQLPNGAINRLLWTPQGFTLVGWSDTSTWNMPPPTKTPLSETSSGWSASRSAPSTPPPWSSTSTPCSAT